MRLLREAFLFVMASFLNLCFGPMPSFLTSRTRHVLLCLGGLCTVLLGACSGSQGGFYQTMTVAFSDPSKSIEAQTLKPELSYLRVSVNGQPALMVLGYLDPHPNGPIEVWYSASKEVIRIQNQRLLGTQGLRINWIDTELVNAPTFTEVLERLSTPARNRQRSLRYTRMRTSMPEYAVNVRDTIMVQIRETPAPLPPSLKAWQTIQPSALTWVSETTQVTIADSQARATPLEAIYAVDRTQPARVLYAKQCIAPNYCVEWQPWPSPAPPAQAHPKPASLGKTVQP